MAHNYRRDNAEQASMLLAFKQMWFLFPLLNHKNHHHSHWPSQSQSHLGSFLFRNYSLTSAFQGYPTISRTFYPLLFNKRKLKKSSPQIQAKFCHRKQSLGGLAAQHTLKTCPLFKWQNPNLQWQTTSALNEPSISLENIAKAITWHIQIIQHVWRWISLTQKTTSGLALTRNLGLKRTAVSRWPVFHFNPLRYFWKRNFYTTLLGFAKRFLTS